MPKVIKARDNKKARDRIKKLKAEEKKKAQAEQKITSFKNKTFEQLNSNDKDELLKAVSLRLKLIKPS